MYSHTLYLRFQNYSKLVDKITEGNGSVVNRNYNPLLTITQKLRKKYLNRVMGRGGVASVPQELEVADEFNASSEFI